ncbi:hypothetical protein [Palaeococcus sp. (in: euryarchaeotes)]
MKLERALLELEKRKEKALEEKSQLREAYSKKVSKLLKEIKKEVKNLEKERIPKKIDERISKIVENERRAYVDTLTNFLERIENIDSLEKFLPELSKFHVSHGKYVMMVFEKRIYRINKLLKELSEVYGEYQVRLRNFEEFEVPDIKSILEDIKRVDEHIQEVRGELERAKEREEDLKATIADKNRDSGLLELEEKIESLKKELSHREIKLSSDLSYLKKPLKKARVKGHAAEMFLKDTKFAFEEPMKVKELLKNAMERGYFDKKHAKRAKEVIENLDAELEKIEILRKELDSLEREKNRRSKEIGDFEARLRRLEAKIREKEEELEKAKRKLRELEEELNRRLKEIEKILGTKIELA